VRRQYIFLIVAVALAASLVTSFFVLFLPRPEVRFFTVQESYRLGETVVFRLENHHQFSPVCYASRSPWSIGRLVGDEWERVEEHDSLQALGFLVPGKSREWRWTAEKQPEQQDFGLAEVLRGEYRIRFPGRLCESVDDFEGQGIELFAHFDLVA
jgi:hypothetical protein